MAEKTRIAFVFPGQGSQFVGMAKDLFDQFPAAKQTFQEADDALGFAISELCFSGPESDLKLTQNTQPAILASSIAALRVIESQSTLRPQWVAGHSLGEYSALVCAGALEFSDALKIVRERGRMMQEAVPQEVGAMGVLLGLEVDAVRALCADSSNGEIVEPANYNGAGQIVIAGHRGAVQRAMSLARERGVKKVLEIPVSAPFHCRLMAPAAEGLKKVLADVSIKPFTAAVITNVEAEINSDPARVKDLLIRQTVSPVRWEESVQKLEQLGCERVFEVGPGKVLRGLIKRIAPSLNVDNFQSAVDLPRILAIPS